MAVLAGLGHAATVAQLVGVDVAGLISKILQAAVTARENKKECEQLARRVFIIAQLLPHLQDDQVVLRQPLLAGLDDALQEAHDLVVSCQGRSAAYRLVMAGRQAYRFKHVHGRIDSYLFVFPVISHIAIIRRFDRIYDVVLLNHMIRSVPMPGSVQFSQQLEPAEVTQVHGAEEFTFPETTQSSPNNNLAVDMTTLGAMGGRLHGDREAFGTELAAVSPFRLKPIARLFRWRVEKEERRMLVCEYVNNGTLRHHLHGDGGEQPSSPSPVMASWRMRVEVLLGASRAVENLHRRAAPPAFVLRRHVSSCNILLDASWTPRVSDLGTGWHKADAHCMDDDKVGYLDPAAEECDQTGRLKPAVSDVYSLGVVMLEVLTGKRPMVTNWDEEKKREVPVSLARFAHPFIEAGEVAEVLDRRPPAPTPRQLAALELVAQTAARCLRLAVEDRPPMSDVVIKLERALKLMSS